MQSLPSYKSLWFRLVSCIVLKWKMKEIFLFSFNSLDLNCACKGAKRHWFWDRNVNQDWRLNALAHCGKEKGIQSRGWVIESVAHLASGLNRKPLLFAEPANQWLTNSKTKKKQGCCVVSLRTEVKFGVFKCTLKETKVGWNTVLSFKLNCLPVENPIKTTVEVWGT